MTRSNKITLTIASILASPFVLIALVIGIVGSGYFGIIASALLSLSGHSLYGYEDLGIYIPYLFIQPTIILIAFLAALLAKWNKSKSSLLVSRVTTCTIVGYILYLLVAIYFASKVPLDRNWMLVEPTKNYFTLFNDLSAIEGFIKELSFLEELTTLNPSIIFSFGFTSIFNILPILLLVFLYKARKAFTLGKKSRGNILLYTSIGLVLLSLSTVLAIAIHITI